MKILVALSVMAVLQGAAAVTHTLQYFYTASSGIKDFPEFVNLGMLDGVQMDYYDSVIRKVIPKVDWMAKNEGPEYWDSQTQASIGTEQAFKANIGVAKQRLNQTGGVHIAQRMFGCEWDDETDEVKGYRQDGYDGEDFISFDLETETWVAPKPEAVITKHKWEKHRAQITQMKNYLTQVCPEWVKKYVNYGRSSLMRKDLPSVSLLQKTPSSPVSCHATGFYPDRAMMFWRKDGEEIDEGVEHGENIPNHDGSFQMNVDLDVSSVSPEDWRRYECVFQLSGVKDDIITKLDKAAIETNWGKPKGKGGEGEFPTAAVIGVVAALLLLAACVVGLIIWKTHNNASDTSSSSTSTSQPEKEKAPLA